jgi:hypothetical protein
MMSGLVRRNLAKHEAKECPNRLVKCELCSTQVKAVAMPSHKRGTCPELKHNKEKNRQDVCQVIEDTVDAISVVMTGA